MHVYNLLMDEQVVLITTETRFSDDTTQDGKHWVMWRRCSGCLHEILLHLCLQSAIMPCLALHSSNTRALEMLISYSAHWAAFFCETRRRVKTIIVGKLAQTICSAYLIYMTFSSLLSKITLSDDRVLIKCLWGQIRPISWILHNCI